MYTKHYNVKRTSQREAIPGRTDMVKNNAGGYGFSVSDWERLDRFLISGSDGGTYYVKEKKLTIDNANAVLRCIGQDGFRVLDATIAVSDAGRAPKNEPAIFVLAMCVAFGSQGLKVSALARMGEVIRTGTHLFAFAQYLRDLDVKWGRSVRDAFSDWYTSKSAEDVAYQVLKYQKRRVVEKDKSTDWSHRDILRLSHTRPPTQAHSDAFKWAIWGWQDDIKPSNALAQIVAYETVKRASTEREVIGLIKDYNLTREMIPTQWLNSVDVWEALLAKMPMTALVRNLGKMSSIDLLKRFSDAEKVVVGKLGNAEYIRKSRLHPLSILVALRTYITGCGSRGNLSWTVNRAVVDALDEAFYTSFNNVVPTGKNMMLALDVSGSMEWNKIAGMPITPREASAAMALVTARVEPNYMVTAFTSKSGFRNPGIQEIALSSRQRLDDVIRLVSNLSAGGTDCARPMLYAMEKKIPVDAFVIYTDNESWAGDIHVTQALKMYRERMGIQAKLVAVAMYATAYSVADPRDPAQMDVVGFDTATPNIISEFVRG